MRLGIAAVGRLKSGPEKELFDRYCKRISASGRQKHLFGPDLIQISEARDPSNQARQTQESQQILAKLPDGAKVILMDERGKDIASQGMADLLESAQADGTQALFFCIGGPDGHGDELQKQALRSIRFGSVTWPHQLVRIMLAEQLYRAITILSGHPYHRE